MDCRRGATQSISVLEQILSRKGFPLSTGLLHGDIIGSLQTVSINANAGHRWRGVLASFLITPPAFIYFTKRRGRDGAKC